MYFLHVFYLFPGFGAKQKMIPFLSKSEIWAYPPKTHFIMQLKNYIEISLVELSKIDLVLCHTCTHRQHTILYLHISYEWNQMSNMIQWQHLDQKKPLSNWVYLYMFFGLREYFFH